MHARPWTAFVRKQNGETLRLSLPCAVLPGSTMRIRDSAGTVIAEGVIEECLEGEDHAPPIVADPGVPAAR